MPLRFFLSLFLAAGLAACTAGGGADPEQTAYTSEHARRADGRPGSHFDADITTLEKVLPWAIQDMHWGQVRLVNEVTALHAAAVTELDREVDIRAQVAEKGGIDVQVKVGHFGDERQEQEFLTTLGSRIEKWQKQKGLRP